MNKDRPLSDLAGKRSLSTYTEQQLRREIERLRDERDEQASIISTYEAEQDEMQKAIARLKSDHTKRETDFRETQRRIAQLEKSLTQYAELVAVKQNVIEKVKEQLKEKMMEADQVAVELKTANMEVQEVKDGKKRLFAEVKELKRTIVVMKGKIALVENADYHGVDQSNLNIAESDPEFQQHLDEKEQIQAQHTEEVEKLVAEIEKHKSDRDQANDNHDQEPDIEPEGRSLLDELSSIFEDPPFDHPSISLPPQHTFSEQAQLPNQDSSIFQPPGQSSLLGAIEEPSFDANDIQDQSLHGNPEIDQLEDEHNQASSISPPQPALPKQGQQDHDTSPSLLKRNSFDNLCSVFDDSDPAFGIHGTQDQAQPQMSPSQPQPSLLEVSNDSLLNLLTPLTPSQPIPSPQPAKQISSSSPSSSDLDLQSNLQDIYQSSISTRGKDFNQHLNIDFILTLLIEILLVLLFNHLSAERERRIWREANMLTRGSCW